MWRMAYADEGIDRLMGALLGYPDEEIDQYVKSGSARYEHLRAAASSRGAGR